MKNNEVTVLVRGTGELGSAIIWYLVRCHFRVVGVDSKHPVAVRRGVAFCEAISSDFGNVFVEGVEGIFCGAPEDAMGVLESGKVAVMVDPTAAGISFFKPGIVIDAIMSKGGREIGSNTNMAKLVVGIGPGFTVGENCHVAIESNRGSKLGRIYENTGESPETYTGVPGSLGGQTSKRVYRAPTSGEVVHTPAQPKSLLDTIKRIIGENIDTIPGEILTLLEGVGMEVEGGETLGRYVEKGEEIMRVDDTPVVARNDGVVRGMIREGSNVEIDQKIADIDSREEISEEDAFLISDKGRCVAGSVLHAVVKWLQEQER